MSDTTPIATHDAIIDGLAGARTARAREAFLRRHDELLQPAVVEDLYARVVRLARIDLQQAERLAAAAMLVAERLADDACRAQSLRAAGHVRFIRGEYRNALDYYNAAAKLYRRAGRDVDVARTLNGG